MSAKPLFSTLPVFHGLDGLPLTSGSVYFGIPETDPLEFPKIVYYDKALTDPAGTQLTTNLGYFVRNGSPVGVFSDGNCSMLVLDSKGRQVHYFADYSGVNDLIPVPSNTVDTFSGIGSPKAYTLSVTPASKDETAVYIGTPGSGAYQAKSSYTLVGNQITINAPVAVNNIEVVTTSTVDLSSAMADIAALATAAGDSADAAQTAATAALASQTSAAGFAAQAATIAAAIGAGGSLVEKLHIHDYVTFGVIATIPDTVNAVTKVYFESLFIGPDTGQYTPATPSPNNVTLAAGLGGVSKVYIFYI